ncbi:MAG: hypothetical protein AAF614_02610 [Chloroflexota bacterium]
MNNLVGIFSSSYPVLRCFLLLFSVIVLVSCETAVSTQPTPPENPTNTAEAVAVEPTSTTAPTETAVPPTAPPTATLASEPATPAAAATRVGTATFTPTPTATATATATQTPVATATETPAPVAWDILPWLWDPTNNAPDTPPAVPPPPPPIVRSPGSPTPYLSQFRLIGFYGSPEGRGLGLLGNQFRNETVRMIRGVINEYRPYLTDGRYTMPVFHMISTVAKPCDPEFPNCSYHISKDLIYDWIVTAENNNAAVTLDIQFGRNDVMEEFNLVREFLYFPHVHLAVDPEFRMNSEQVPNQQIGTMDAADINAIQAEMNQIALELGVNRVLIIHQFKDSMLTNKHAIANFPHVEVVINGDGYGPPGPKIRNYQQYTTEGGFDYGGFKIFTDQVNGRLLYDSPFMLPEQVMTVLNPQPVYITFQ